MIDIHCHILPGVDDGPNELLNCLVMANAAVKSRITNVFATPHHLNGRHDNPKEDILHRVLEFNRRLKLENIPLTVHPGQELRLTHDIFHLFEKNEVLTLDNRGKHLLLELPSEQIPAYTQETVYELLLKGITPIIAHPERNLDLIKNPNLLFRLIQEGALSQVTAGSILGHFGKKIKSFAEEILEHDLAHFISSDAHNISTRGFHLLEAYDLLTKKYGINQTLYFKKNAEFLLEGKSIIIEQPVFFRKKFLGIF